MKKSIASLLILFAGLFTASVLVMNCSGKKTEQTETEKQASDSTVQQTDMPMDSTMTAYACPMHPEVTGKEGDKCSKCGMKLEAVKTEHQH